MSIASERPPISPANSSATTLRYSLVVPVFNEASNIEAFCARALAELSPDYELLICYDFDGDSTLPALAALPSEKKPSTVRLVRNDLGRGVRYAIEAGMRAAVTPIVVVMMADLSDDFGVVDEIVRRCEAGANVVCPSRYMRGGKQIGGPWLKGLMSRVAGNTLYYFAGLPTHDPTNSFKAYRKSFLDAHRIDSTAGFCLGLELTVKCHWTGGRVEEVPATWFDRTAGESRFKLMKWLPMYIHWYRWGIDRSRRFQFLAVCLLILITLSVGLCICRLGREPITAKACAVIIFCALLNSLLYGSLRQKLDTILSFIVSLVLLPAVLAALMRFWGL